MSVVARPVAVETTQIAVETVGASGVKVPANRLLQAIGFSLDPEVDIAVFGPAGQLYDTAAIINREWSSGSLTGTPDYREIGIPLSGVFGDPTISTVTSGVYDWIWNPRSIGGLDRPRTFSLEHGVAGMSAEAVQYLVMTAINQNFSREGGMDQGGTFFARRIDWTAQMSSNQIKTITPTGTISGGTWTTTVDGQTTTALAYTATATAIQTAIEALSNVDPGDVLVTGGPISTLTPVVIEMRGRFAQQAVTITVDGTLLTGAGATITPTTSTPFLLPTALDVQPIMPGEVNVYVDTTFGAIGTSQYTSDFACGWAIGDRRNPVWTLNRSLNSFAGLVETKPNPTFTLSVNDDDTGRQLIPVMRAGTSRFIRIECIGPVITPGYNFEYVIDLHGKIVQAPAQGDVSGTRSLDWTFRTMHSSAWGQAIKIRLRTDVAALAAA
jgi:hypothetical protein